MDLGILIAVLAGWISGWAVNYFADTLPITRRLSAPACRQCGQAFPLAQYLTYQACPHCGHRRGARPWLVQLAMLAVSVYTWIRPNPAMEYALGMLLITYFGVVVVIDLEHRLILHPTSIVGAVLALGIGLRTNGPIPTVAGGLGGFLIMLALYYFGVLFSKYRARRLQAAGQPTDAEEALGAGDVILAGILGLVLGWLIWPALLLGILLGGLVGIVLLGALLLRGLYGKQALMVFMPYGPYFIASAFFILFVPNWITGVLGK